MKSIHNSLRFWGYVTPCLFIMASAWAETNLIHRWSFNETSGTTVADSIGGQNGTLMRTLTNGSPQGALPMLDGVEVTTDGVGGYVDLGNGIFSGLSNVTVEIWFRYYDNTNNWVNLLCAGAITTTGVAGQDGTPLEDTNGSLRDGNNGTNYYGADGLFFTPRAGVGENPGRFAISDDTNATFNYENPQLETLAPLDTDVALGSFPNYIAITYGPDGQRLFNFHLQQESASVQPPDYIPLSDINDVNIFLGRSLYGGDPMLNVSINELRIHDTILTAPEIAASYFNGYSDPNIVSYNPGTLSGLSFSAINPDMYSGAAQPAQVTASYSILGDIPIYPPDLDLIASDDTDVLDIVNSDLVAVGPGTATLTVALDGITNSLLITVVDSVAVLQHRWSFNESPGSSTVVDSVGGANGTVVASSTTNVTLTGTQASFPGEPYQTAPYIDLPDGILSARTNVTIEGWFTWNGPAGAWWQRIFTLGNGTKTNGNPNMDGVGLGYMFLTPHADTGMRLATRPDTTLNEIVLQSSAVTSVGQEHHFVVVYAPDLNTSRLYLDQTLRDSDATPFELSGITDTNNWLGVSQWPDAGLNGTINELRIYEGVMTPLNIALSAAAGPDGDVSAPGALVSVAVVAQDILIGDPDPTPAYLYGTFENVSNVNMLGLPGASMSSSDTNVILLDANGLMTGTGTAGQSATISGNYYGDVAAPVAVSILPPTNLVMTLPGSSLTTGGLPLNATLTADFDSAEFQDVDVLGFNGVVWSSSDETVAAVSALGVVSGAGPGTAEIVASYGGLSVTNGVTVALSVGYAAPTLIHRYSFATNANDSVGTAHGTLVDGALAGTPTVNSGQLFLNNPGFTGPSSDANYLSLPPSILPSSGSATIETWHTFAGSGFWAANWAFSDKNGTNNPPGEGNGQYLAHTISNPSGGPNPAGGGSSLVQATSGYGAGGDESRCYSTQVGLGAGGGGYLDDGVTYYSAAVIDGGSGTLKYYVYRVSDGVGGLQSGIAAIDLSAYSFNEAFIGKSVFDVDNATAGSWDEIRIWNGALVGADIDASFNAGPDNLITPIAPTPQLELTISGSGADVILNWSTNSTGFSLQAAPNVTGTYSGTGLPSPSVVGDQYQVTVPRTNQSRYFRLSE